LQNFTKESPSLKRFLGKLTRASSSDANAESYGVHHLNVNDGPQSKVFYLKLICHYFLLLFTHLSTDFFRG
jgi:hypothetical protein